MNASVPGLYDFEFRTHEGRLTSLREYAGRVLLLVNTASQCGFTPQYAGLEALHRRYSGQGLSVLGFPCNQFGGQEPGTDPEIQQFCQLKYDVTFPVFARVEVNGTDAHPLFTYLKKSAPGILWTEAIKWNFTKFLLDRKGERVARHGPHEIPESLSGAIEALLAETP